MKTLLKNTSLKNDQKPKKLNLKCKNLFFNLINKVFKKNSVDNKILDNDEITSLITIFSKKGEKNEDEISHILSYLNGINFFTKIDLEDQIAREKCINALRLKGYSQGDTILNEDDEGNSLILLLYGSVSRQIVTPYTGYMLAKDYINYLYKVKNEEKNEKKLKRLEEYNKSKDNLIKTTLLQTLNYDMKNVTYDMNFYGEFILEKNLKTEIFKGKDIIGERSFVNKNTNNEISHLIAENDCVVIILDKKDYIKIIEEMNNFKINNLSKKLKENFQIFKNWNKMQIAKLIYNLKKVVLKKDQILYTQNSPPDYIYFIFQGKLENKVSLDLKKHGHYCDFINSKGDYFLSQLKKTTLEKDSELMNKLKKETKYFTINKSISSAFKNMRKSTRNVKEDLYLHYKQKEDEINQKLGTCQLKLSVIENCDVIGIEECIENKGRFSTVKVLSQEAILYKVSIEDFLIILNNRDTPILQITLLVKERKENLIKNIKKAFDSKSESINRRIITELSMYVNKSKEMKESNDGRILSHNFTVKTYESSNTLAQSVETVSNIMVSKQSLNRIFKSEDSIKDKHFFPKRSDLSNKLIESSFRSSSKKLQENEKLLTKQHTLNEKFDKNKIWKNVGFYHTIQRSSNDDIALINLNHFVKSTEEPNNCIYPKRPFSCTIKKMKNVFFQKKQSSLKENSEVFKTLFSSQKSISSYKSGYLVSKQQSKYFKNKKKL